MPGGALIVIGMVLVAPVVIFLGGAVWSALAGPVPRRRTRDDSSAVPEDR